MDGQSYLTGRHPATSPTREVSRLDQHQSGCRRAQVGVTNNRGPASRAPPDPNSSTAPSRWALRVMRRWARVHWCPHERFEPETNQVVDRSSAMTMSAARTDEVTGLVDRGGPWSCIGSHQT
jgi:hypothetical protein